MHRLISHVFSLCLLITPALTAQTASPTQQPTNPPAKHSFPKPKAEAAPGGGPDKVWVNTSTKIYHCYGDRYYGKTKDGKYMTEAEAKALGAKGTRGETCSK
jgi:hypothetical protein